MPNIDTELISTKEASELLGDNNIRKTIRRIEAGDLTPARKLPGLRGAYIFNRSDVLALLTKSAA